MVNLTDEERSISNRGIPIRENRQDKLIKLKLYVNSTAGIDSDSFLALLAIEKALSTPFKDSNKQILEILTVAFSLLELNDAQLMLNILEKPQNDRQKYLQKRFERLASENRNKLKKILKDIVNPLLPLIRSGNITPFSIATNLAISNRSTLKTNNISVKPRSPGSWSRQKSSPNELILFLDNRISISDIATYISDDSNVVNLLAEYNKDLEAKKLLDKSSRVIIPSQLITRNKVKASVIKDILQSRNQQIINQKYLDFVTVDLRGIKIGLAPITTEALIKFSHVIERLAHAIAEGLSTGINFIKSFIELFSCLVRELTKTNFVDLFELFLKNPIAAVTVPHYFSHGIAEGIYQDIEETISLIRQVVEDPAILETILDQIWQVVHIMSSNKGSAFACDLGKNIGKNFVTEINALSRSNKNISDVAFAIGKLIGPFIFGIFIGIVLPAATIANLVTKLPKIVDLGTKAKNIQKYFKSKKIKNLQAEIREKDTLKDPEAPEPLKPSLSNDSGQEGTQGQSPSTQQKIEHFRDINLADIPERKRAEYQEKWKTYEGPLKTKEDYMRFRWAAEQGRIKTNTNAQKINLIVNNLPRSEYAQILELSKEMSSQMKGQLFETWVKKWVFNKKKIIKVTKKDNYHLGSKKDKSRNDLLESGLSKESRTPDHYDENTKEIWDYKNFSGKTSIDEEQLKDYRLMEEAGVIYSREGNKVIEREVIDINYLFSDKKAAQQNADKVWAGGGNVWYIDNQGVLKKL